MATALFMQRIIEMTDASCDQEHIEMIIYNKPSIPDRTGYILDHTKANPLEPMAEVGNHLANQGVDVIAIPCITSTYFYDDLTKGIPIPVINGIDAVCSYLNHNNISRVGLMATSGTIASGLFQDKLAKSGIELVLPDDAGQSAVMSVIYDGVKAGKPVPMDLFHKASVELRDQGAEVIILGCTELSVVKSTHEIGSGFLDALDVLAQSCVNSCGTLKKEYIDLIIK